MTARRARLRQIVETLSRHGLGFVLGATGLESRLPGHDRHLPSQAERVRLALEELGPTFMKLGQIASTRPDILSPPYVAELSRLQDAAPPIDGAVVARLIETELGAPPRQLFDAFDDVPIAAASIGQAHAAVLGGVDVVVKVRRPGIVEDVRQDLDILRDLAVLVTRGWERAQDYDVVGIVEEFSETLRAELDYVREARNAERFARMFDADSDVHVPRVFWEATSSRVLTLERIRGIKISDVEALDAAGVDRSRLAVRATGALCTMIFEEGFFHADPHPGNIFVEPSGRLGIIDFGMVGEIDDRLRAQLVRLLLAITRRDPDRMTTAVLAVCGVSSIPDRDALRGELSSLVNRYARRSLGDIPIADVIPEILVILRMHRLHLPRELAVLLKTIVMADGLGKQLDPDFDLMAVLAPYTRRLIADDLSPIAVAKRLRAVLLDAVELGAEAPDYIRRALDVLERGGFDVHIRTSELEPLLAQVERIGNRVVAGTVAAALISGLGRLVTSDNVRLRTWERPLIAVGFAGLGALGAYLALPRRRRRPRWP